MQPASNKRPLAFILFCLALGAVFLTHLAFVSWQPLIADDLYILTVVRSVSDIFTRAWWVYWEIDGRVGLVIIHNILFSLPRGLGDIARALVPVFTILACYRMFYGQRWKEHLSGLTVILLCCGLWWVVPGYGEAFLWLTATNYSTAAFLAVWALVPFADLIRGENSIASWPLPGKIALLVPYLLIGLTDHLTVGGMLLFIAFALAYNRIRLQNNAKWALWPVFGLVCGLAIMLTAPGNYARAKLIKHAGWFNNFWGLLSDHTALFKDQLTWLAVFLLVCLLTSYLKKSAGGLKKIVADLSKHKTVMFFLAFCFVFSGIICASALYLPLPPRAFTFGSLMLLGAIFMLVRWLYHNMPRATSVMLALFTVISICSIYGELKIYKLDAGIEEKRLSIIAEHPKENLCLPPYLAQISKFSVQFGNDVRANKLDDWRNTSTAMYYDLPSVWQCTVRNAMCFTMSNGTKLCADQRQGVLIFAPEDLAKLSRKPERIAASHIPQTVRGLTLRSLWPVLGMNNPTGWRGKIAPLFYRRHRLVTDKETGALYIDIDNTKSHADLPIFLVDPETGAFIKGDRSQGYYQVLEGGPVEPYNF